MSDMEMVVGEVKTSQASVSGGKSKRPRLYVHPEPEKPRTPPASPDKLTCTESSKDKISTVEV